ECVDHPKKSDEFCEKSTDCAGVPNTTYMTNKSANYHATT
ncbi:32187_t:CDS:1, partial [Racocetra persica]